ncbi:MAG: LysR family transcriptional regulator [Pseudomonadales bacterium]|nr:LysR family transcriptional regulator [Pseudomonadales bacterium]
MDRSLNFDWNHARAFLATVDEGSLSAAARTLGVSQPTLGRQVSALEQALGMALFERHGQKMQLTPAGAQLVEHVRAMGEAAEGLSLAASGHSDSIAGRICISATEAMAMMVLPTLIKKLKLRYPSIVVDLIASNATSDLKLREADIAIRSYRPTQPGLIARKLAEITASLYATTEYLQSLPHPLTVESLTEACFIGFNTGDNRAYIESLAEFGLHLHEDNFCVNADSHLVHWELTKQGLGIGVMPTAIGDHESGVVRVITDRAFYKGEMWLVSHRELRTNKRVRAVFDFLAEELREASPQKPTSGFRSA